MPPAGRERTGLHAVGRQGPTVDAPERDDEEFLHLCRYMQRWAGRKKVRLHDGSEKMLPWAAIEVRETFTSEVVLSIDWLPLDGSEAENHARDIWERVSSVARRHDDGRVHKFVVRCIFADLDADRKADLRTDEECDLEVTVAVNRNKWGRDSSYRRERYGRVYQNRDDPHHVDQEQDWADMHIRGVQRSQDRLEKMNDKLLDFFDGLLDKQKALNEQELNLRKLERSERWEDAKQEAAVAGMKMIGGRLAKVLPAGGMRLMEAISDKLGGKKPEKTGTEKDSYDVLTHLVRQIRKKVEKMGADAGSPVEFTPDLLKMILKKEFDVDPDDPIVGKLFRVLADMEVERIRLEAEGDVAADGGVVVEQKKEEKGAAS